MADVQYDYIPGSQNIEAIGAPMQEKFNALQSVYVPSGLSQQKTQTSDMSADSFAQSIGLVPLDFLNTVASSVGFVEEDFLALQLKQHYPQVYNTYMDNKDGIQIASNIGGALIPGTLAVRGIQAPSKIGRLLKAIPNAEKLFVNAEKAARLDKLMATTAMRQASAGIGGSQILNMPAAARIGKSALNLKNARRLDAVANGVKEAAAGELAIYATMNTSNVLYGEDMSAADYLLFNGGGALLGVGLNYMVAAKAINEAARRSANLHHVALGETMASLQNSVVRPGNEDIAITENMLRVSFTKAQEGNIPANVDRVRYMEALNRSNLDSASRVFGSATGKGLTHKVAASGKVPEVAPSFALSNAQNKNLEKALTTDPTAFLGVKELRDYETDIAFSSVLETERKSLLTRLDSEIDALNKQLTAKQDKVGKKGKKSEANVLTGRKRQDAVDRLSSLQFQRQQWAEGIQPYVLRNGAWQPMSDNVIQFTDDASAKSFLEYESDLGVKGLQFDGVTDPTTKQRIAGRVDYDLNYAAGKGDKLGNLSKKSLYEQSAIFALYDKVIDNLGARKAATKSEQIRVSLADDWRRLDAIDEGLRRKKILDTDLLFPAGVDLQKLRETVLHKKFVEYNQLMDRMEAPVSTVLPAAYARKGNGITPSSIRYMLNIPEGRFGEISPLEGFFLAARGQGAKSIDGLTLDQIADQALKYEYLPQGMEFLATRAEELAKDGYGTIMRGSSFAPARYSKTEYLKPVIGWRLDMDRASFNRSAIDEQNVMRRAEVSNDMLGDYYDGNLGLIPAQQSFAARLTSQIMNSSAYGDALNVTNLNQASLRTGVFGGRFATQAFIGRDDPTLIAVNAINALVDRETNLHVQAMYTRINPVAGKTHSFVWGALREKNNAASLFQYQEYARARHNGWYLQNKPKENGDGTWSFVLDHQNEYNHQKFRALFGRDMQKGDVMPRVSSQRAYEPLAIDKKAYDAAESFRQLGSEILGEQNRLRKAMGLSPIQYKEWWVPNRVFTDKHVAWVVSNDGSDKIVNAVTGNTDAELQKAISSAELGEYLASNNARVFTQGEIEEYMGKSRFLEARDRAVFEVLDANDMLVKGGSSSKGSSVNPFASSGIEILDEGVRTINKQMQNISRDTVSLAFESQIAYAGRMKGIDQSGDVRNVWDYYKDNLLGNRALYADQYVNKFYQAFETSLDRSLQYLWDHTNGKGITGTIAQAGKAALKAVGGPDLDDRYFKLMKKELGDWLPYQNTQEFLSSRFNVKPPTTSKELMAGFNSITSTVMLRFLDLSQPLMNFTGLVATSPAVIQALKQHAGETVDQWKARIGGFSSIVPSQMGEVPFFNSAKVMAQAAHMSFSKAGKAEWEYAKRNGYLKQQVAEIHEILEEPLKTEKQMGGFVEKWMGRANWAADQSEETSRGIAHMAGLILAKQHGIVDQRHRHTFANRFANDVIGDYRSINKPVVFQGAAGMPLGLFQTYAWNYYQRMFGYLENAQYKAAAVQFAMQASMFGAVTVPGYSLFNGMWNKAMHNEKTPVDSLQAAYPGWMTDLLLYGTISNIPKIFGLDGMALYSRGDANPRVPAFLDPSQVPLFTLADSMASLLGGMVDQVRSGGQGLSAWQTMELLGTYSNNRTLSRLFELAAGYSIDRRGNVINADTQTASRAISSVLGLRTLNEAKNTEVLQRQKASELAQYAMRTRLTDAIKSATRHDGLDEGLLRQAISDYAVTGGDPEYFPRFLKTTVLNGTTDRAQVRLMEFLRSDHRIQDAMRLMNAGVRFDPDEAQIEQMEDMQ